LKSIQREPLMLRFTIRDVLWLTVVVALAVGWGLDRVQLQRAEKRARMEAEHARYVAEIARASEALAAAAAQMQSTTSSR
jgi:hypothetical protein